MQEHSEGERLKNAIRGKVGNVSTIEQAAEKLGVSRQRLAYHLQKAKLDQEIKDGARDKLGIHIFEDQPELELNEPGTDYIKESNIETKLSFDLLIYFMGQILKLPLPELLTALKSEPDPDRRKVIMEVINTKEKMQLMEERLKDKELLIASKDALIEQLKKNLKK